MVFLGLRERTCWVSVFPAMSSKAEPRDLSAHWYSAVCDETAEKGNPSAKEARKSRVQGRFLAALEMTVWGMGLFHVAYNGYVWKALFLYRHPERSRGIFLAGRDNVVCVIAENGNPSAKEARKRGVRGIFLDFAGNDGMGDG